MAPDSGVDQMVARIVSLKTSRKWSDLSAVRRGGEVLEEVRGPVEESSSPEDEERALREEE